MIQLRTLAVYAAVVSTPVLKMLNKMTNDLDMSLSSWNPFTVQPYILMNTPAVILLCSDAEDVMTVSKVDLSPNPPIKGQNLTVKIEGILSEDLSTDATMFVSMKKGMIKFPRMKIPACDYFTGGCPISKGPASLEMMFEIPQMIPGGSYEVRAILYNVDKDMGDVVSDERIGHSAKNLLKSVPEDVKAAGRRVACAQGQIEI